MRVIKRGTIPENIPWFGECRKCTSEIEAEQGELKVEMCPRERYKFAHHACPVCGHPMLFHPKQEQLNG